jgi:hypothetical protein
MKFIVVSSSSRRRLSVALNPTPITPNLIHPSIHSTNIIAVRTQPRLAVDAAAAHTATAATLPYGLRVAAHAHLGEVVGDVP